MQTRRLREDERAADKIIVIALASLLTVSVLSALAYMSLDDDESNESSDVEEWIDPVVEIDAMSSDKIGALFPSSSSLDPPRTRRKTLRDR